MNSSNVTVHANSTEEDNAPFVASLKTKIVILSFFGLVLLIGVVGNILVLLLIALEKSMHTTVNRCLFVLAVADLLILSFLPVMPIGYEFLNDASFVEKPMCYFLVFYDRCAVMISVLIFCFLSINRYFAICHPLKIRRVWSGRNTYIVLVIIWILSIGSSVPYLYIVNYERSVDDNNVTSYNCYIDLNATWKNNYDASMTWAIYFIPVPILVYLYGKMISALRTKLPGSTGSERSTSGHQGRRQVMIMLLAVVIIFLICQIPLAVVIILDAYVPTLYDNNEETMYYAIWVCRILVYVNSAANPVVYFSVSSKFREAFVNVFCCRTKAHKEQSFSSSRRRQTETSGP